MGPVVATLQTLDGQDEVPYLLSCFIVALLVVMWEPLIRELAKKVMVVRRHVALVCRQVIVQ